MENGIFSNGNGDLPKLYSRQPGLIPVEDFTREDRERAIELLLSQERVVTLLYAKAFPVASNKKAFINENLLSNNNSSTLLATTPGGGINRATTMSLAGLGSKEDDYIQVEEIDTNESIENRRPLSSRVLGTPGDRDRLPTIIGQGRPSTTNK